MNATRFRILAIDGGGIKGVFPASFLATLEEQASKPIGRYFDLIAGTSTGGIIALGLSAGLTAHQILGFYESQGPSIFPNSNRVSRKLLHWVRAKYAPAVLKEALVGVFGDRTIADCTTRLIVPSLNAVTGDLHIYKTRHHPKLVADSKVTLVDAALATTAAPSYFPRHVSRADLPMIDGGIWANNPTGLAAVEAVTMLGVPLDGIEILSLGCTESPSNFEMRGTGKLAWAKKAIEAAMCGQSFGAMGTASLLVGHNHVHRFSPSVAQKTFQLDSVSRIQSLKGLGYHEARKALTALRPLFLDRPAQPFAPYPATFAAS